MRPKAIVAQSGWPRLRQPASRPETAVVDATGRRWRGVRRLARERDADVIVCGSRGLGPFSRAAVGSTSSGLLHHADRPVLVVPEGGGGLTGPVIVRLRRIRRGPAPRSRVAAALFPARRKIVVNVWESLVQHSLGGRALASGPLESARTMSEELDACFDAIATDIAEQGADLASLRTDIPRRHGPSRRRAPPGTVLLAAVASRQARR